MCSIQADTRVMINKRPTTTDITYIPYGVKCRVAEKSLLLNGIHQRKTIQLNAKRSKVVIILVQTFTWWLLQCLHPGSRATILAIRADVNTGIILLDSIDGLVLPSVIILMRQTSVVVSDYLSRYNIVPLKARKVQ